MILKIEMLGWVGTALVLIAYVPQIRHLYVEKCAWGISISTWLVWLVAAALLLTYCMFRNDTLFTLVQVINIAAIVATIILARRSNGICPYHLDSASMTTREISLSSVPLEFVVTRVGCKETVNGGGVVAYAQDVAHVVRNRSQGSCNSQQAERSH